MTTRVQVVKPEPRLIVNLELSVWHRIADNARYQAERTQDWSIVNLLDDAFREVDRLMKEIA